MSRFKSGDRVFVYGEPNWQGNWECVPGTLGERSGTYWYVHTDYPVKGWGICNAAIEERFLSTRSLEELARDKLGDDYL